MLSGRGLCDELITRPEKSYRLWWVIVRDLENLKNEEAMNRVGSQSHSEQKYLIITFKLTRYLNIQQSQFKQINQRNATVSQVYYLTFICSSTGFGRLPAHHQELTTALGASRSSVSRKRLQPLPANGRTRGSQCSRKLLMMGGETPETC